MELTKIEKLFIDKFLDKNGVLLLTPIHSLDFINECERQNVLILGIDAFIIDENKTQPLRSIDFTSNALFLEEDRYHLSREFIKIESSEYYEIIT